MAEVLSIIKYICTAAAGAVTGLGWLYLYNSVYSSQPPRLTRPLRVLITAAGGGVHQDGISHACCGDNWQRAAHHSDGIIPLHV